MSEQEIFWRGEFGDAYSDRNSSFDDDLQIRAWRRMLRVIADKKIDSILECGCNTGRNLVTLRQLYPRVELALIEVNKKAYEVAVTNVKTKYSFNGPLTESNLTPNSFDIVFTCGVLIHIAPYDLLRNMSKIYDYSRKYILFAEYFGRSLEMKPYHGHENKLFKMDFGGYFIDNFNARTLDYGFLWGREFDDGGFDDMTWWLFEKEEKDQSTL